MREFSNFETYGVGTTRREDGRVETNVVVAQTLDVIKESARGDFLHATPFRHIKVSASGRVRQLNERWYDQKVNGDNVRRYIFSSEYVAPMIPSTSYIPYVTFGNENGLASLWVTQSRALTAIADNKCLDNLAKAKFTLGETLVELCETVSFVTTKIVHFMRVLVDLKHGRFSNAMKQLGIRKSYMSKPLSERWLEAQFALRPLIGEIEQARQFALNKSLNTWYCISARGTARRPYTYTWGAYKTEMSLRLTTDAKWNVNDHDLRFLMQLGMANPLELLWEFLPLSWLVDYVVGVGDWIAQLMAPMGCVHVTTSRSMKVKGKQTYSEEQVIEQPSIQTRTKQSAHGIIEFEGLQRRPDIFAPAPTLQYKLPLNVNQLANIAALTEIFTRGLRG